MGVNLAVRFDGFMKSHSKAESSLCANVEALHPTGTLCIPLPYSYCTSLHPTHAHARAHQLLDVHLGHAGS